jgi:hypothetical protein
MSLKLNSVGGGSVTLQEPNTASNFTLDLPAASGTVALTSQIPAATSTDYGAIGTYVSAAVSGINMNVYEPNSTVAGSSLIKGTNEGNTTSSLSGTAFSVGVSANTNRSMGLSGTWRAMAFSRNQTSSELNGLNLWVRIS